MSEPLKLLDYALTGGPPDNWQGVRVFDLDTGLEVRDVVECNAVEGWLIRAKLNEEGEIYTVGEGDDAEVAQERIDGRFILVPPTKAYTAEVEAARKEFGLDE
jgi:hypothetical protein